MPQTPAFLSGADIPEYLRGVEIATAGMDWPASTGTVTVTMEHLAAAVAAAQDPHIQAPRVKLGHTSAINGDAPDHDPFAALGDAEPSFGVWTNLRLTNDGAVLVGDMDAVPAWLAASAPSSFPNRSMEATWDVQTAGGKRYSMVVTAVSLLGTELPAVSDLEDLSAFITGGPDAVAATKGDTVPTALSVSADTIRQRFNFGWAMDPENGVDMDTYWWWARDIRVDPAEVIADDDEGNLWAVPFSTDGDDEITFGEPQRVRQTYVPATSAASFTRPTRAEKANAAHELRPNPERTPSMDSLVRGILVGQGLDPDAATEEQINAAQTVADGLNDTTPAVPENVDTADTDEEPDPEVEAEHADPIAAAQAAAFAQLSTEVQELRAERDARTQAEVSARRDANVLAALREGRISAAEREHYRGLQDIDETRAQALLSALPAGRVPLAPHGEIPVTDDHGPAGFKAGEPLPPELSLLTPAERASKAQRAAA